MRAQGGGLSDELQPYVDSSETASFDRMGELLRSQKPQPRRSLVESVGSGGPALRPPDTAPEALGARVLLALLTGLALLALALLGASGSGPLG